MPEPITKSRHTDAVLAAMAAMAARHEPGQVVTLAAVMAAAGISQRTTGRGRRWAPSAGLWPYRGGWSRRPRLATRVEDVLAAVAGRYRAAQAVSLGQIAEAGRAVRRRHGRVLRGCQRRTVGALN